MTSAPSPGRNAAPARGLAVTVAAVWGTSVTAAMVAVPLALRDRLPDPLATHWSGGSVPDDNMSFAADLVVTLALWGVAWIILLAAALHGAALRTRIIRINWWAFLFGWAVFALGVQGSTLYANLDAATWREAELPPWTIFAVLLVAFAVGTLAGYLGRGGPDPATGHPAEPPPAVRLRPGRRTVWVSRVSNPWLTWLAVTAPVAALIVIGLAAGDVVDVPAAWSILSVAVPISLLGVATATVRVTVDPQGLRVGLGPWGWPARRTPAGAIESAWAERRTPGEVGGWGVRSVPGTGRTTLMLRGGDHLVIRRARGGEFAVSADDAERGAALLNAYIAEAAGS
ncbi:hypothetical protein GCM10010156_67430 [Planobispora rosea]|uniref:DUF1648 domain-containing protein n=1 Tax=Planobispora rosea TaxID=35762 RepID=A0A8J3S479_PLARO|nr:DUF1648 domain-containing protein [Planobispora rosea]GGS99868.1 hypothetical protein GCM10010156_67430 [Planobispora rosea]GIH88106.1 hypothetical protein Pro02_65140 [Planobispora rosea]